MHATQPAPLVHIANPAAASLRRYLRFCYVLVAMLGLLGTPPAIAQEGIADARANSPALDQTDAVRAGQGAVGRSIGDYALFDVEGRPVRLSSYRGKPLLVSFIYTGCFRVCPGTTQALQKAASLAQDALGQDKFNVISVGFNQPADSPQAMKSFAAQNGIKLRNWDFLSPPAVIVPNLARDFGFSYVATPAGFDHVLQVSVIDAQGRIYRQIYGDAYSANKLIEPLQQLISGTPVADSTGLAAIVERVRILCSVYDPLTGEYRMRYGLVLEIAGGVTFLLWMIWFFLNEWLTRRNARRRRCA